MRSSIFWGAFVYLLLTSLLSSGYPVLDEEGYIHIADQLSFARPYDWSLPWPPYNDSYRYAHPPLFLFWVRLGLLLCGKNILLLKLFLGFPFRIILGGCAGYFFYIHARNPRRALIFWMCSPIILLIGARSCMPDLMLCTIATAAMVCIFCVQHAQKNLYGGILLGIACWVKYPALLLWFPILAFVVLWRERIFLILGFLLVWGVGEAWLAWMYGDIHLLYVLQTADHVGRSSLDERAIALLLRFLVGVPCALLLLSRRMWMWPIFIAVLASFFLPTLSHVGWILALFWVSISGAVLLWSVRRFDVMSLWVIAIVIGVWATHNFAAPRYLGMAILPFALLLDKNRIPNIATKVVVSLSFLLSFAIAYTEHKQAQSTVSLLENLPTEIYVSGEWTIRWKAREMGIPIWKGESGVVIQPKQAVGGSLPKHFRLLEHRK